MVTRDIELADVWERLASVPDPEIPVISILDLGIVRDVAWLGEGLERSLRVTITPTYSGCPAMRAIERDIVAALRDMGVTRSSVEVVLSPAWTTDWLTATGREKLRSYGISPPRLRAVDPNAPIDLIASYEERVACPRCASSAVELVSRFGSTPCKALYRCTACWEPFDHFKAH